MPSLPLPPPVLEHLCDLVVEVGQPVDAGVTPFGRRRCVPILGGTVSGALSGTVVPGGVDVQLIGGETVARLDAQYVLALDDGARVFVRNSGLRAASVEVTRQLLAGRPVDPKDVYFRGQVTLECGDARWSWLGERQFVSVGEREPARVVMSFYVVR